MRAMSILVGATAVVTAVAGFVACTTKFVGDDAKTGSTRSSLEPGDVEGNPTCASLGFGTSAVKIEDPENGTFSLGGDAEVVISNSDGATFDWSATIGVDAVIVKGGPNAKVYVYDPESMAGTGLHAPINPNTGNPYGLSHIDFCVDDTPEDGGGSSSGGSSSGGSSSGGSSSGGSSSGQTW